MLPQEIDKFMKLKDLINNIEVLEIRGDLETEVCGIASHSSYVSPGGIFFVLKGQKTHGRYYLADAINNGAGVIIFDEPFYDYPEGITLIQVQSVREAMGKIAAKFYGYPAKYMTLVGITGTNGKTTTSHLIASILNKAGFKVGIIGTIGYTYCDKSISAPMTTPESIELQKLLTEMLDAGITHVVMEVSSHALAYERVAGCGFKIALFTNLSRDHLDFHKDMKAYFYCKKRLFTDYLNGIGIVNKEDNYGKKLLNLNIPFITYGLNGADITAKVTKMDLDGTQAEIRTPKGAFNISTPLLGMPNVANIMAATGAALGLGTELIDIKAGIEAVSHVPGRLQRIEKNGISVIVDYAHTPDALRCALSTLRKSCSSPVKSLFNRASRLITVFGCGGDRDRGKRKIMGEIAGKLSDLVIITNDNPRTESPEQIVKEIEIGLRHCKSPYFIIYDRKMAIRSAIRKARRGDIVLIAGKGHETYQILGERAFPFSDIEEVKEALDAKGLHLEMG